ncbi:GNAT family protein [Flavobacterium sp. MMLR14_040]|uniref:GNAT family N-acetyltransferase n=1 Tax=Flavobacterium sp. MMLR14_040 TaxID=3093843 RepID=UPI0029904DC0|nr:GNAT family protein [Flavobacterium sp. MMLR14_040]MDW8849276.1 GNAT family protein [Flavobacterium sp. MMLR14_040]
MRSYKCLSTLIFRENLFSLVPIRDEDKYDILKIRNEQIYHLRQKNVLTKAQQDYYFSEIVAKLFEEEKPNQILFSLLKDGEFIGYGGLVHINWIDKNAEISFIMKTELEQSSFSTIWLSYLKLIEKVAFDDLKMHKIFTYAFDLRPHLYTVLENANFVEDARLKEHCFFDNEYIDVVIHSKINRIC